MHINIPFILYRLITTKLAIPIIHKILDRRVQKGKETQQSIQQRQGISNYKPSSGPVLWVHAASVGESLSVLSLIDCFLERYPDWSVVLTTGTLASYEILKTRLPERVYHQFVPLDIIPWVRRFLDTWHPCLAFWIESELWPNLLYEAHLRHIPLIMLNGRISKKSFERWQWASQFSHKVGEIFHHCFALSREDKERLEKIGFKSIQIAKNLKFASQPLEGDQEKIKKLKQDIGSRKVWMAVSTHDPEEEIVLQTHLEVKKDFPDLLTLLVVRHPQRAQEIKEKISQEVKVVQRSVQQDIPSNTDIYLVDTLGELGNFYPLVPICFVGGSLAKIGGHNLIEPAHFGAALLHGPYMYKCEEVKELFHAQQAAIEVSDQQHLARTLKELLGSPALTHQKGQAAKKTALSQYQIIDQVLEKIGPIIEKIPQFSQK